LGSPFPKAGSEAKGKAYLVGARRRRRPNSAAARPVVAARKGRAREERETEKGTGKETEMRGREAGKGQTKPVNAQQAQAASRDAL
jgi:hypothetical protein